MQIILHRSQLLYDIANACYAEAHRQETLAEDPAEAHLICDVTADGNIDRIDRIIALLHASAVEMLSPLARTTLRHGSVDNRPFTPDAYLIDLREHPSMPDNTLHLLARLIHAYIVAHAVEQWLSVASPSASAKWAEKAAICAADIRHAVADVVRGSAPLRRRISPL